MMKMNGLKIMNYWIANYIFFFSMFMTTGVFFFLFGYYIVEVTLFTETNQILLLIVLISWASNQVSLSFLLQAFI